MKKISMFKKIGLGVAGVFSLLVLGTGVAHAIPYDGPDTPPSPIPAFNVYTGNMPAPAPLNGEPNFFRGRVPANGNLSDATTPYTDPVNAVECTNGKKIQLHMYVHNGASADANNNGTGPSVAHGTKVKVALPTAQASNFNSTATISATNTATVNDGLTINCGNKSVKLKYVPGSATQFSNHTGRLALPDSIVGSGASIKSRDAGGDVWGCWDDRVYVVLVVEVEEVPVVIPQTLVCTLLNPIVQSNRTVRIDAGGLGYTATGGATFNSVTVNWGDGSIASNVQLPQSHTYAQNGTYNIVGSINGVLNGQPVTVSSVGCAKPVVTNMVTVCDQNTGKIITVDQDQAGNYKPVGDAACKPVPTKLVDTGTGSILGIFTAVTAAGAIAHRIVLNRRFN